MSAAQLKADRAELLAFLGGLRECGRRVPCMDVPPAESACFTSVDESEQAMAARLCVGCAGATTCGLYGAKYPSEFGVYGGATNNERQPKRGRPRGTRSEPITKESAA
ncbi:MAG: hypothetical protein HGA44_18640 [Cellulomonadaceae bacterium]|nr:hypothetical protein [Cellulomonadaceae bacterium]